MPTPTDTQEAAGFQALASITLLPVVPPVSPGIQNALARLLEAASSGQGSVPLRSLQLSPDDLRRIQELPQFFHHSPGFLQLPRYASYESEVYRFFEARLQKKAARLPDSDVADALNAILPHEHLERDGALLFDNTHQRLAIAGLLDSTAGILTGGPGTGKTTTAAALLAVRRRLDPSLTPDQVLVTAPTGKAACRIGESIRSSVRHLKSLSESESAFLQSITARTLHRALEWGPLPPEEGGPFRRGPHHPLEARIILVDEASMADLSLMRALVRAVPEDTTLLLLGDSDQLESVEVGGVLLNLVRRSAAPTAELLAQLAKRTGPDTVHTAVEPSPQSRAASGEAAPEPLPGLAYRLAHSRRAMNAPWILQLAARVRPFSDSSHHDVQSCIAKNPGHLFLHPNTSEAAQAEFLLKHWQAWIDQTPSWKNLCSASDTEKLNALAALGRFQLLCSTNRQVDRANQTGLRALSKGFRASPSVVPHGCPILIEKNSPSLNLTNGDVGIALGTDTAASLGLFHSPTGGTQLLPIAGLPKFSPAFGLTIHKSQGSEWETVAIELPPPGTSGLLTRNLLYTAITRASRSVHLIGSEATLQTLLEHGQP